MRPIHTAPLPLLAALAALVLLAPPASAQGDAGVMLGFGGGRHEFYSADDFRAETPDFGEMERANLSQAWLEWYAFGTVGFGVRALQLHGRKAKEETVDNPFFCLITAGLACSFGDTAATKTAQVDVGLATLNAVIPLGGTSGLGFIYGAGNATYAGRIEKDEDSSETADITEFKGHATGPASYGGVFLDFGGPGLGARLGGAWLETDLPELDETRFERVSAAGAHWTLDLRWGW